MEGEYEGEGDGDGGGGVDWIKTLYSLVRDSQTIFLKV